MYCPSCGKSVPDNSKFCLHCGSSLTAPTANAGIPAEWEYYDYLRTWKPGEGGKYKLSNGENENTIRLQVWNQLQSVIMPEIQQVIDKGWQPITQIGPAAFSFFYHSSWSDYLEVTEFRVKMRRPKQNDAVDVVSVEPYLVQSQLHSRPVYESQIVELVRRGRKIEAIKIYREHTRAGLRESKDYVDSIERNMKT